MSKYRIKREDTDPVFALLLSESEEYDEDFSQVYLVQKKMWYGLWKDIVHSFDKKTAEDFLDIFEELDTKIK